jgi:cytochrome c oxidase subunit 2
VSQKRILIVSQYSLFDQGIRAALGQQADVEVVGVCRNPEEAYALAQSLHPDVLVLIAGPEIVRDSAFRLLEEVSSSIIRISPTDGTMQVYRRENVGQATLNDLVKAIQATASRWRTGGPPVSATRQFASQAGGIPTQSRRANMKHLIVVGILVAIITVLVAFGLNNAGLLPAAASEEAVTIDSLFKLEMGVIAFLFSLIVVMVLYSVIVFRRRAGDTGDGPHHHGNGRLEIIWTVIPLFTVLYFSVLGVQRLQEITRPEPDEIVVDVTSLQFAWQFTYPDQGITSPELNLPRGRQVVFRLQSRDVIHSFWVPEFRVKQDAVPGMITELRVKPTEAGQYKVRCAELCGTSHYAMLATVNVMEPADFDAWLAQQTAALQPATAEPGAEQPTP